MYIPPVVVAVALLSGRRGKQQMNKNTVMNNICNGSNKNIQEAACNHNCLGICIILASVNCLGFSLQVLCCLVVCSLYEQNKQKIEDKVIMTVGFYDFVDISLK